MTLPFLGCSADLWAVLLELGGLTPITSSRDTSNFAQMSSYQSALPEPRWRWSAIFISNNTLDERVSHAAFFGIERRGSVALTNFALQRE